LIGFEATLRTPHAVFEMSSTGPAVESDASVGACMVELRGPARYSGSVAIWSWSSKCCSRAIARMWQYPGNFAVS
jgi:hypothetical protein